MICSVLAILLLASNGCANSNDVASTVIASGAICSDSWYQFIERRLSTGDGHGHGPDLGSDEWKSVLEFKLGIRGRQDIPARNSEAWCIYIDQLVGTKLSSTSRGD